MVSKYRIVRRLGAGGMGTVYLAQDTDLHRSVALKILPPETAAEPARRFQLEARTAASLNHPNIAHIYEIGESGGVRYIAMERAEGQTLAELLLDSPPSCRQILDIGIQVAEALQEAHSSGITHRDIKPANIMVGAGGKVKVLDFGLAKVKPRGVKVYEAEELREAPTLPITTAGMVVGTVQYMSPEQALGEDIDHRSDLFSLGAVLYEMATGERAFPGNTPAAVFDAILNRTPASPRSLNPDIPEELERILYKALEKDRQLRYQTAADLRADLSRLQRNLGSGRTVTAPSRAPASLLRGLWLLLLALWLGAAGSWFWFQHKRIPAVERGLQAIPLTSNPGSESQPSFSPDGNQVAYSWNSDSDENWEIYVRVVGAGTPLRLTNNPAADISPAWSPDGRYIAFVRQSEAGSAFYLIPALGGLEQKVSAASPQRVGVDSPYVSWLPDSKELLIVDKTSPEEPMSLFRLNLATGTRRKLTHPPAGSIGDSCPALSPDGRRVAFVRTHGVAVQDIYVMFMAGGEPVRLTSDNLRIFGLAWNPRNNRILFSSGRSAGPRIWSISPNGGKPQRLAGGFGENASFLAINKAGDRLAYSRILFDTNVWRYAMPGTDAAATEPVRLVSSTRLEQGPKFSPDGERIAFASNRGGSPEIWISDPEGISTVQLTSFDGPATGSPFWSPDGSEIVFDSRPNGNPDIYVVSTQGGAPRRITTEPSQDVVPSWSRDGKWIYFASNRSGRFEVWKAPARGGAAVQLTRQGGFHGFESPDGKYLYYAKSPTGPGLWRIPVAGGREEPALESLGAGFWAYWTLSGQWLFYLDRRETEPKGIRYDLRRLDLNNGQDRPILRMPKRPFNSGLSISPDGKWILYTQVDQSDTDIMLVNDFRY